MIGSSPNGGEDSVLAPLLDVEMDVRRPTGEVIPSFRQYAMVTMMPMHDQDYIQRMTPLISALLRYHPWNPRNAFLTLTFLPPLLIIYLGDDKIAFLWLFAVCVIALLLVLQKRRDRRYYDRHGAVRYTALMHQRIQRLGMLSLAHLNLGWYHEIRGEHEAAIACYQQLLDDHPFLAEDKGGVCLMEAMAKHYYAMGQYEASLEHISRAAALRRRKDPKATYRALKNERHFLGKTYAALGRHAEALGSHREALRILRDAGFGRNVDVVPSLILLVGEAHEAIGGAAKLDAAEAYREALEIRLLNEGEFPRTATVAMLHDRLGDLCHNSTATSGEESGETASGHWNAALEVYRRAGKTDEDTEIIRLQSKIQDALVVA